MLSQDNFERWCKTLNLSDAAQILINQIRNSPPVRSVRSFRSNVTVRFPSRKMGVTIQAESHKCELPFVHEYEYDKDTLEFYDQPIAIKLEYEAANGRQLGVFHTPDFFVMRTNEVGWEECKTEEELITLAKKSPNRYSKDSDGKWQCLPGEEYAQKYGFYYRIRSTSEINWIYQRNLEFLEDYFRNDAPTVDEEARNALLVKVNKEPGISLKELLQESRGIASNDDAFMLIAAGDLYVNLRTALLIEQANVRVFSDSETAKGYKNLTDTSLDNRLDAPCIIDLTIGNTLQLNEQLWKILIVDSAKIGLISESAGYIEIHTPVFEKLIKEGRIKMVDSAASSNVHPEVKERLEKASPTTFAEANRRYELVCAYMRGDRVFENAGVSERTVRFWVLQYRKAQKAFGNGYIGLLPSRTAGNIKSKLPITTHELITDFIDNHYETHKQKGKSAVYAVYQLNCKERGVIPASYKTFCRAVKLRSRYNQTLKRQGKKAAYKDKEFYWELTPTTPRHGERPLHIVHIDHTELDIELVCSITGQNLGRAWATFLTDAYSRRLAVHVTYDPPSYRSCMMILRECVRRFCRLPQIIIVDGGREFSSTYFDTLLARYECTKKTRPPSESRFGSVGERPFGTVNTQLLHNLQGNTQMMRNVRQVTKSVNPRESAIWTLEKMYLYLRDWAYEVYDTIEHPALGQSPRDAYARGLINAGARAHKLVPYDEEFKILTLPTTTKSTAKVCVGRGVKVKWIYYWSDAFRHPEIEGKQVDIRYDPFDMGHCYAYVRGQWHECYSGYYATLRNRSEREVMFATAELRRRHTQHSRQFNITTAKLAGLLESIESEEALLKQRMVDRESRNLLALLDNVTGPYNSESPKNTTPSSSDPPQQSKQANAEEGSHKIVKLKTYGEF